MVGRSIKTDVGQVKFCTTATLMSWGEKVFNLAEAVFTATCTRWCVRKNWPPYGWVNWAATETLLSITRNLFCKNQPGRIIIQKYFQQVISRPAGNAIPVWQNGLVMRITSKYNG